MYQILFTPKSRKQLLKFEKDVQKRILKALNRIKIRPEAYLVKLVDDPSFKFRVGNYRLFIDIMDDKLILLVVKVGHRRHVYKQG